MKRDDKIYIAGHTGLIGFALLRKFKKDGYRNLVFRTKDELDLIEEKAVRNFFDKEKPDYVFLAAGKSGGILANTAYPADLIYKNIKIESNVIHQAYKTRVKKLLYIGCACLYPRECPQPMKEEYILKGKFEPTNEMFSVAKLAGLKMCQAYNKQYKTNFIACIVENLFGPNDKFDLKWGHVVPSLIERFHNAKIKKKDKVVVWGSGKPVRSFMYIEDAVDAFIFLMNNYSRKEPINVGSNLRTSIKGLAELIKDVVGFKGKIMFDTSKPDGMPKKTLDTKRLFSLGWRPKFTLEEGIKKTYRWYLDFYIK